MKQFIVSTDFSWTQWHTALNIVRIIPQSRAALGYLPSTCRDFLSHIYKTARSVAIGSLTIAHGVLVRLVDLEHVSRWFLLALLQPSRGLNARRRESTKYRSILLQPILIVLADELLSEALRRGRNAIRILHLLRYRYLLAQLVVSGVAVVSHVQILYAWL